MLSIVATLPHYTFWLIVTNFVLLVSLFVSIVPPQVAKWYRSRIAGSLHLTDCAVNLEKMRGLSCYLEQLESHLSVFFLLSEDLMCIADDKGYFVKVNPAWSNLLGWTQEELIGCPYTDFVHPEDLERTQECARELHDHAVYRFRNRFRAKDGTYKRLSWTSSPFTVNGYTYAVARHID